MKTSKESEMGSSGHRSGHSKSDVQDLYNQIDELREMVRAMSGMPEEIKTLRKTIKILSKERGSELSDAGGVDPVEFKKLKEGCVKLQSNMKKQNAMLQKELAEAKTKIEEQGSTIKDCQRDIDALKMELREATKKASKAENDAKKALAGSPSNGISDVAEELAVAKSKITGQEVRLREQQHRMDALKQEMLALKAGHSISAGGDTSNGKTSSSYPTVASEGSSPSSDSDMSESKRETSESEKSDSDSDSDNEAEERARQELARLRRKRADDSDAESESDEEPAKPTTPRAQRRGRERKFEAYNVPRGRQVLEESDSEAEGDIEIDVDDDEDEEEEDDALQPLQPGTYGRRSSIASVESVESVDTSPRKKTISLLPHKSADLYNEQRKDAALRKLMMKGKSTKMKVRKVHGKSLVFFSDRIYIPESLRQKSLDFYWDKCKKQKLNPLVHLEKNCFWPDMKDQYKKYDLEKSGKYIQVEVSYVKYTGSKPKEEFNYDCVGLSDE